MFAIDLILKEKLESQWAALRTTPRYIDDIFRGVSSQTLNEIKQYIAENPIPIHLGWRQTATTFPLITVIAVNEQETQQYLGSEGGADYLEGIGFTPASYVDTDNDEYHEEQITQFSGRIDCAIYSVNAIVATWLSAIVQWSMLRLRAQLEDLGMLEQRVSMSDFMPSQEYPQPDASYTRVVTVNYVDMRRYAMVFTDDPYLDRATELHAAMIEGN